MDAFAALEPISDAYATLPIAEAFDWSEAAGALPAGAEWYLVAFRSVRRADADEERLCAFDERAHLEAAASPGFVHYFKGPTSSDGSCLSFCLWDSRADARACGRPAGIIGRRSRSSTRCTSDTRSNSCASATASVRRAWRSSRTIGCRTAPLRDPRVDR